MAEVVTPVQMVALTYACDECGEDMEFTGYSNAGATGPWHGHRCTNGHTAVLFKHYPSSGWRPLEADA